ncbi:hypothetical protein HPB50_015608 [Hyalomma asiaticum]|uniref:Uncharacterized protein n=1 Tax=Hyalomma asiaticum TaxID=266040 RepID=A0ACB7SWM1_HYAAI|nr:hypothetical protein HPB50_015608 [Hyalomma asiaticum]
MKRERVGVRAKAFSSLLHHGSGKEERLEIAYARGRANRAPSFHFRASARGNVAVVSATRTRTTTGTEAAHLWKRCQRGFSKKKRDRLEMGLGRGRFSQSECNSCSPPVSCDTPTISRMPVLSFHESR